MSELTSREIALLREHFPEKDAFDAAAARVLDGEPLAYVIGEWYFWRQTYHLNRACLIPRPDTEHLVEWLVTQLPFGACFADLCTGSGCIAISALAERPDLHATAVELSAEALEMAERNAKENGVADRLTLVRGDVLLGQGLGDTRFDAIVSNPPYIRTSVIETLSTQVQAEPHAALDGGADGLDFYRAILKHYPTHLKENGIFLFEIGYDQADDLRALHECEIRKDYGGNDRIALIRF